MMPDRPAGIDFDKLSIDQLVDLSEVFDGITTGGKMNRQNLDAFKELCASCSDWTREDIGKLNLCEFKAFSTDIMSAFSALKDDAVPPPTPDGSASTPPG